MLCEKSIDFIIVLFYKLVYLLVIDAFNIEDVT